MTADTLPATGTLSPGAAFAAAFAVHGERTEVSYDYTVTDAHKPDRPKPRLTVRGLLKRQAAPDEVTWFWTEGRSSPQQAAAVTEVGLRREAAFRFGVAQARVHPVRAWVQIPAELAGRPEGLAEFIDHRLLVRLATAENQALTIGRHGLLSHPEIARLPYQGDYADGILAACDEIEQTGSTAHAMIVNPRDYYRTLVGRGSLLADLAANGTRISRILGGGNAARRPGSGFLPPVPADLRRYLLLPARRGRLPGHGAVLRPEPAARRQRGGRPGRSRDLGRRRRHPAGGRAPGRPARLQAADAERHGHLHPGRAGLLRGGRHRHPGAHPGAARDRRGHRVHRRRGLAGQPVPAGPARPGGGALRDLHVAGHHAGQPGRHGHHAAGRLPRRVGHVHGGRRGRLRLCPVHRRRGVAAAGRRARPPFAPAGRR